MKLYTEVSQHLEEQIVIRCKERTDRIRLLESVIENMLSANAEITLTDGETEYFIRKNEILYFETEEGKVMAHTADRIYYTANRLFELEQIMGPAFQRISKSCIVNCHAICAIRKNLTGAQLKENLHLTGDLRPLLPQCLQCRISGMHTGGAEYQIRFNILQICIPQTQLTTQTLRFGTGASGL